MKLRTGLKSVGLSLVALLLVVGILYAATTIGSNISTDGTLLVGSTATFNGNMKAAAGYGLDAAAAGDLNLGTTTATTINLGNAGATINVAGETVLSSVSNLNYAPQILNYTNSTATLTPTSSYVLLNCSVNVGDTAVTLSESGARAGQVLLITTASATAGTCSFADIAGVQNVAGSAANRFLSDGDAASFVYNGSEWIMTSLSSNHNG